MGGLGDYNYPALPASPGSRLVPLLSQGCLKFLCHTTKLSRVVVVSAMGKELLDSLGAFSGQHLQLFFRGQFFDYWTHLVPVSERAMPRS